MSRQHFTEQLEHVELQLLSMGELASSAVQRAVEALVRHDDALAERVVDDDDAIDELYLPIDHDVLEMLALQSPVATQLRLVSAILHSCLHLERIGDQAVNIAKLYLATRDLPPSQTLLQQLDDMGTHVVTMIRTAMEAFRSRGPRALHDAAQDGRPGGPAEPRDPPRGAEAGGRSRFLDWGMHMNLAARALERVGDNAVDIAEQVGFLITGEFREFTDASHEVPTAGADA